MAILSNIYKGFTRLPLFKTFWPTGHPSIRYNKIELPTRPSSALARHEAGLGTIFGLAEKFPSRRGRPLLRLSLIALALLLVLLGILSTFLSPRLAAVLLSSHTSGSNVTQDTGSPPVLIHTLTRPPDDEVIKCHVPFQVVEDPAKADVVIWSNPELNVAKFEGAAARLARPWQIHAFWSLENAAYYPALRIARQKLVAGDPAAFDLEMTYRTTSDVPVPYAYWFIDFHTPALPFSARRQDKLAVAFVSNCSPFNNRNDVLKELIRLLPGQIDSFGACHNNANADETSKTLGLVYPEDLEHPPSRWTQKMRIIQRYKFTIAFENTDEEDYVTEKYYQALAAGSPPIHLGLSSSQFPKFKPSPKAALNVADFASIKELAQRMEEIGKDERQFEEMNEWKGRKLDGFFGEIVRWNKDHELCRLAKFVRKQWSNPHALKPERYEGLYSRIKLKPHYVNQTVPQSEVLYRSTRPGGGGT